MDYMDRKASCMPVFIVVLYSGLSYFFWLSPPVSQGTSLSALSIGGEPFEAVVLIDSVSLFANFVGNYTRCWVTPPFWGVCTHYCLAAFGSQVASFRPPPPTEDTLFQVVAHEEVVGSIDSTVSAVDGPLTEGAAINAIFDHYMAKQPEAGSAGVSTLSAAPTTTWAATSLTWGSLPRPSPSFSPRSWLHPMLATPYFVINSPKQWRTPLVAWSNRARLKAWHLLVGGAVISLLGNDLLNLNHRKGVLNLPPPSPLPPQLLQLLTVRSMGFHHIKDDVVKTGGLRGLVRTLLSNLPSRVPGEGGL